MQLVNLFYLTEKLELLKAWDRVISANETGEIVNGLSSVELRGV